MTLVTYMAKNALRNRRRTALTALSLAVSLTVIMILQTILLQMTNPSNSKKPSARFVVRHRVSLTMALPRPYEDKLRKLEGLVDVTPMQWFGGIWKDMKFENFFPQFAVDPDHFFNVYDNLTTTPEELAAWKATRNGCLIGRKLASRHGFKVGDTIAIKGDIFDTDLELKVVGFYEVKDNQPMDDWCVFQIKYLDELLGKTTRVSSFFALADSPARLETLLPEIETLFRNSDAEVKAETEKAFQMSFVEMMGNVQTLINTLVSVVVFAVVLIAASTMALTVRERTREVATLKALGFARRHVLALIVGEGVIVSALGGLLGIGGSALLLPKPTLFVSFAAGVIVAMLIGFVMMLITFVISETKVSVIRRFAANYGSRFALGIGLLVSLTLFALTPNKEWIMVSGGMIQDMTIRTPTILLGIIITAGVGLFSSLWPAFQAARLSVLDGLRRVD